MGGMLLDAEPVSDRYVAIAVICLRECIESGFLELM